MNISWSFGSALVAFDPAHGNVRAHGPGWIPKARSSPRAATPGQWLRGHGGDTVTQDQRRWEHRDCSASGSISRLMTTPEISSGL